jgi:hypothetical protein
MCASEFRCRAARSEVLRVFVRDASSEVSVQRMHILIICIKKAVHREAYDFSIRIVR